jgi:hypothetical protein
MKHFLSPTIAFARFAATSVPGLMWLSLGLSVLVSATEGIGILLLLPMLEAKGA